MGSRPVTLVTGPRQTGKTALLRHLFPRFGYVSLDLPHLAEEAEADGERFLERHPPPHIFDEVQYAPRLLRFLKAAIDQSPGAGSYVLTGSQKFSLMQGVTESLAGRVSLVELNSLSLLELERGTQKRAEGEQFWNWLVLGGYPGLHAQGQESTRFYSDYVSTYLERDVRQALAVRSLRDFDRFLRLLALRTGQLLNAHALATEVGVAATTIQSWLSVLEASGIIVLLRPYFRNAGKRLVKTPKLYFLDTGLCCFLVGIRSAEELQQSSLRGAVFETQVVAQLVRYMAAHERRDVYFYRDHHGTEVDVLIPIGERFHLLECKVNENQREVPAAFGKLANTYGDESILSRTLITPRRGVYHGESGLRFADCVDFSYLDA